MTTFDPSKLIRVADLPEKLSVSRSTMYGWFRDGLRRVRLGNVLYVDYRDLEDFQRCDVAPTPLPKAGKSKSLARIESLNKRGRKSSRQS